MDQFRTKTWYSQRAQRATVAGLGKALLGHRMEHLADGQNPKALVFASKYLVTHPQPDTFGRPSNILKVMMPVASSPSPVMRGSATVS